MRYDLFFIPAALLCLLTGVSLGMWMGIAHDFTLSPVHAHLNLLGWVTLAAYGLMHRAYPELASSRLAGAQCVLAIGSSVAMPLGIAYAMATHNPIVATIAALGVFSAALTFLIMFARKAKA